MNSETEKFEHGELTIDIHRSDDDVTLIWRGRCVLRNPEDIFDGLFKDLINQVKQRKLVFDFTRVLYVNSGMLSPLLQFIKRLDSQQIPTVLVYDTRVEWQLITCRCMRAILRTLSRIEVQTIPE
jgi:hypothetical protein